MLTARRTLGTLWLLDALLQAIPANWSGGLAGMVTAAPLASCASAHPALANLGVVLVQLTLGLMLLTGQRTRLALIGSILWALAIWAVTGFGGVFSPHPTDIGAPPLYALLALIALTESP